MPTTEEVPVLTQGCRVKLVRKPAGCLSQHLPLTVGNIYKFKEWSGSNVIISTDVQGEDASIHFSRVEALDDNDQPPPQAAKLVGFFFTNWQNMVDSTQLHKWFFINNWR